MRKLFLFWMAVMISFAMIISAGCKKKDQSEPVTGGSNLPTEIRSGQLVTVDGSAYTPDDFTVYTLIASANVGASGAFSVTSIKADRFQMVFFLEKTTKNLCYIGLYNPVDKVMEANLNSTARALLMFTPNLFYTTQSQREEYLNAAVQNPKFTQMESLLDQALENNATEALNFEKNAAVYQLAAQLMKETMESLSKDSRHMMFGGEPTVEDAPGANVVFVNPRHVYYGTGIYPNDQALNATVTTDRQASIVGFQWGWPPVTWNEPAQTTYALGDGYFRIFFHKGFDFSDPQTAFSWNHPVGRGTICNVAEALFQVLDLITGFLPELPVMTLPNYLHLSPTQGYHFFRAISAGDPLMFVSAFLGWLVDNKEGIAYWFFQEGSNVATHEFINNIAGMLKNVNLAIKFLNFANGGGPFFYDLIFAPSPLSYYVTQQNGILVESTMNAPPLAVFTISPSAGIVTTVFTFDASGSADDQTPFNNLQFRWDFDSDGTWDTPWATNHTAQHTYTSSGSYQVTLSVKDESGLTGNLSHKVNIGGGAGSAKHVKVFMDDQPWDSYAMITMLESLGFTQGTGENTYEIISSYDMAGVELFPGSDLIILCNDQPQGFYNNYSANQVKFSNFVFTGGSLLWEACDEGWNYGSMSASGMTLPGNIQVSFKLDYHNYVTDQNLPLVAGLPNEMDHNYASHESFYNLPEGTTVYCVDSDNNPTLIECNLGDGWIILSGQPLEHQYDRIYGAPDMEQLLPRIVSYFTGKSYAVSGIPVYPRTAKRSAVPSSLVRR